jgi:Concanavalin A-like lectin/glucanases superfamily
VGNLIDYVDTSNKLYTRIDEIDANTWIVGYTNAPYVVPDSEPFWAIQRISKSGQVVTTEWANEGRYVSNWTDRYTYFGISGFSNLKSVFFDGANDYLRPASIIGNFGRTSTFSVSMWVRPLSLAGDRYLIGNMQNSANVGWSIRTEPTTGTGRLIWNMFQSNGTNEIEVVTTNTTLQIGQWAHLVFTYNGSGNASGVVAYLNGSLIPLTVSVNTLSTSPSSATTLHIGSTSAASPSGFFTGDIDEVSVHSNVLSAGEVTTIYNGGDPLDLSVQSFYSTTLFWWRMGDNDTFPIVKDQKGGVGTALQMYNSTASNITGTVP